MKLNKQNYKNLIKFVKETEINAENKQIISISNLN